MCLYNVHASVGGSEKPGGEFRSLGASGCNNNEYHNKYYIIFMMRIPGRKCRKKERHLTARLLKY